MNWFWLILGLYQIRYLTIFFICSCSNISFFLAQKCKKIEISKNIYILSSVIIFSYSLLFSKKIKFELNKKQHAIKEIEFINSYALNAKILNHWNYGSSLIFYNENKIFVDGRASTAYPDSFLIDYFKLSNKKFPIDHWTRTLEKYKPDLILWPRNNLALKKFLTKDKQWKIIFQGEVANIYEKQKTSTL